MQKRKTSIRPLRIILNKGQKFGWLTVIGEAGRKILPSGRKERMILCKCECGEEVTVFFGNLVRRPTISCGCHKENIGKNFYKHGLVNHPIYWVYQGAKRRTEDNPKHEFYSSYYGRGIRMCEEWKNDFLSFYNWAINNGWKKGLELDRRNNDGNYEPSNCRFVTAIVNCNNRRDNIYFDFEGEKITLSQLARMHNMKWGTIYYRVVKIGMSLKEAITKTDFRVNRKLKKKLGYEQAAKQKD